MCGCVFNRAGKSGIEIVTFDKNTMKAIGAERRSVFMGLFSKKKKKIKQSLTK